MDISINNRPADIKLDTEKTLGDVLQGIELWISPSGNRIRAVSVNGSDLGDTLSESFGREVRDIKKLDIAISSWRELAAEALLSLLKTCEGYENAAFDERSQVAVAWKEGAAARFLASDLPDLYDLAGHTLSGEGFTAKDLCIITEERLREISDPRRELAGSEILVKNVCDRMEELPLDIQTGKDERASESVQLFSRVGEKMFRILFVFKSEGLSLDAFTVGDLSIKIFMEEFNAILIELSAAYENRDTVLVGDLAEYELAPRLKNFFMALKNYSESSSLSVPKE